MDYKLAKKLKNAGYPQKSKNAVSFSISDNKESVYLPTLEELIEACKPARILLTEEKEGQWFAFSNTSVKAKGVTPEQAVANLWLNVMAKKREVARFG